MSNCTIDEVKRQFRDDGGDSSRVEHYFLQETPNRLARMRVGNATFPPTPRDLSMRTKEYWETRPSPAKSHHWTANEFSAHLDRHRFPAGTINDRVQGHKTAICRALIQGEFVPDVVMQSAEGRAALDDAIMEVKSLDEGAFRSAQQAQASSQFKAVIDGATIEKLVLGGVVSAAHAKGAEPQPVIIENYPRPVWCVVSDDRVLIKDSGWPITSLYGTIQEIDWNTAESIVRNAIVAGEIGYDDSLWFMGSGWVPYADVRDCSPSP